MWFQIWTLKFCIMPLFNRRVRPFLGVFAGNCGKYNIGFACPSVCITLPCHWIVMKFCMWKFYYLNGENEWLKSNVTGTLVAHGAPHLSGMCSLCIVSMFGHCISVASNVLCESGQKYVHTYQISLSSILKSTFINS